MIGDLPDGRVLGGRADWETERMEWLTCRVVDGEAADVEEYGTSLALLLDAALDSGGDISHLRLR